ncbi:MAG: HEPN domain-containing protein [Nitrospirae bacterium]|nr:HEPN domain-containing protein [Nitrospirota bacterium]
MERKTTVSGTPQEWLNRAKSNLAIARQPATDEIYLEDLCFETQQAAEKALKAVLLEKGIKFRYVHDLAELLTLLERNGVALPDNIRSAAILTDYSVEARYPGPFEPVSVDEFNESLKLAEAVVEWAETQIA